MSVCIEWRASVFFFFFQAEDGIRDYKVTGVQTCALPISSAPTLSLAFLGTLRDKVGQGNSALSADSALDGTFRVTLGAGSGARTVAPLELRQTARGGGVWGTHPPAADLAPGGPGSPHRPPAHARARPLGLA